jgi:hypothetical protein
MVVARRAPALGMARHDDDDDDDDADPPDRSRKDEG